MGGVVSTHVAEIPKTPIIETLGGGCWRSIWTSQAFQQTVTFAFYILL